MFLLVKKDELNLIFIFPCEGFLEYKLLILLGCGIW